MHDADPRTERRLAASAATLLAVLVGVSLAPWFAMDIDGEPRGIHVSASAWRASTLWEWSVLCAGSAVIVAAMGTWLAHRYCLLAPVAALLESATAVSAVGLWLRQWLLIRHPPSFKGAYSVVVQTEDRTPEQLIAFQKDSLPELARPDGYSHEYLAFGAWVGLLLIAAIAVVVVGLAVRWFNGQD